MRPLRHIFFGIVGSLLMITSTAATEQSLRLIAVVLAPAIEKRNPVGAFGPGVSCRNNRPPDSEITTIDSSTRKIFLWTKIAALDAYIIQHRYYMEGYEGAVTIRPTEYSPERRLRFIASLKAGLRILVANVGLAVRPSPSWRTWSSKEIDPNIHKGQWRVEVVSTHEGDNSLCTVYFNVR